MNKSIKTDQILSNFQYIFIASLQTYYLQGNKLHFLQLTVHPKFAFTVFFHILEQPDFSTLNKTALFFPLF